MPAPDLPSHRPTIPSVALHLHTPAFKKRSDCRNPNVSVMCGINPQGRCGTAQEILNRLDRDAALFSNLGIRLALRREVHDLNLLAGQ